MSIAKTNAKTHINFFIRIQEMLNFGAAQSTRVAVGALPVESNAERLHRSEKTKGGPAPSAPEFSEGGEQIPSAPEGLVPSAPEIDQNQEEDGEPDHGEESVIEPSIRNGNESVIGEESVIEPSVGNNSDDGPGWKMI